MKVRKFLAGLLSAAMVLGTMAFPVFAESEYTFDVDTASELKDALNNANSSNGQAVTINITENIDATGTEYAFGWDAASPVSSNNLTINGNGHTISNMTTPLISYIWTGDTLNINNLTIDSANIDIQDPDSNDASSSAAAFVAHIEAIDNVEFNGCRLTNSVVNGGHWNGGFVGYAAGYSNINDGAVFTDITFNNCEVSGNTLSSEGSVGGLMGHAMGSTWTKINIINTSVLKNTITCTGESTQKAGAICGTIGCAGVEENGKIGGMVIDTTELADNTVKSNGVEISSFYGRQGNSTGVASIINNSLIVDGAVYTDDADFVKNITYVAEVNGQSYETLQDAVAAAENGDTVTILKDNVAITGFTANKSVTIDLNGHNCKCANNNRAMVINGATLTYENGTIDLTGAVDSEAFFETNAHLGTPGHFVFKNMTIKGDGYNAGYAVIYVQYTGSSLVMDNVKVDLKHDAGTVSGFIKSEGSAFNKVTIKNSTIALDDTYRGMVSVDVDIDENTTITAKNSPKTFFRNVVGNVNGNVTVDNYEFAVENDEDVPEDKSLIFGADVDVSFSNCTGKNILLTGNSKVLFEGGAKANFDVTAYAAAGLAWDPKDNTVKTLNAVLENNKDLTDTEITDIIEDVKVDTVEQADEMVETIKAIDKDVQKDITPEKVEEIIKAQATNTDLDEATKAAGFTMDNAITVSVAEKADTTGVNVVLTSGANNKVYDVKAFENTVEKNETSTPVLVKIKTDKTITKVLHDHNGTVKSIPFTQANGYVMFTMNEFSNVALVPAVTVAAGQAKLSFVPQSTQPEGKAVYDVVLTGENFDTVKNFVSGEFVTQLTGNGTTPFEYVIESAKNVDKDIFDITYTEQAGGTRLYKINLNEFTESVSYTTADNNDTYTNGIILGTMTVDGYGSGSVVVKADGLKMHKHDGTDENLVQDINTIPGETATFNIAVPTRDLTINVKFPNTVNNNVKAYQDMQVTISGGDLSAPITKELGNNVQGVSWNGNGYTLTNALTLDKTYTVTVSGAGYRTARYNVTMTDHKILNFWNNVKNNAEVVEVDNSGSMRNVTFLAGELVRDNQINIYDLSAVVSYFGTINSVDASSAYAKYDLNRDGKIDSRDVAYVLVSWGN